MSDRKCKISKGLIIKVKKVYAIQISFNVLPKGGILYKYRKTAKVIKFLSHMKFLIFNQTKKLVSSEPD